MQGVFWQATARGHKMNEKHTQALNPIGLKLWLLPTIMKIDFSQQCTAQLAHWLTWANTFEHRQIRVRSTRFIARQLASFFKKIDVTTQNRRKQTTSHSLFFLEHMFIIHSQVTDTHTHTCTHTNSATTKEPPRAMVWLANCLCRGKDVQVCEAYLLCPKQ